ncbi:MAG: O-antigen ligase family protein, partial [Pseudomonadota bacterium]
SLPRRRRGRMRLVPTGAAIAYGGVLVLGLVQLLPLTPGLAHPIWQGVDAPGAITINKDATRADLVLLVGLAGAFIAASIVGSRRQGGEAFRRLFLGFGGLYGALSLVAFVVEPGPVPGVLEQGSATRLSSTFLSANSAATFFSILMFVALGDLFDRLGSGKIRTTMRETAFEKANRVLALPIATGLVAFSCLVLTASRGAISLVLIALLLLAFFHRNAFSGAGAASKTIRRFGVLGLALAVGTVLVLSGGYFLERLTDQGAAPDARFLYFGDYLLAALERPIFGHGYGTFQDVSRLQETIDNWGAVASVAAAHNAVLQWAIEGGTVGLVLMIATIFGIYATIIRAVKAGERDRPRHGIMLALGGIVLGHSMVDFGLEVYAIALTYTAFLGLQFGETARLSASSKMASSPSMNTDG